VHAALRQKLTHLPERLVRGLLRLSRARLMGVFVTLAVLIAVIIVLTIDLLWDGRLSAEMEVAGIVTSLIDASLVVGLMAMVLDALRAEVQHREGTEQVLKEAQRIAHIGNWTHDFATHALHWSDEIYRIFEIDPGHEVSYENFLEQVHPEDRERVDKLYRQSLETKRPYEATHRLLMSDGRLKYVFERGETLYDAAGQGRHDPGHYGTGTGGTGTAPVGHHRYAHRHHQSPSVSGTVEPGNGAQAPISCSAVAHHVRH
jgi:PAS domain-containing protein